MSILVPIFQDAPVLDLFLSGLHATVPDDVQLIMVDDGCGADARDVLSNWRSRLANRVDLLVLTHSRPIGDGGAFNEGLKRSRGDIVVRLDSDLIFRGRWLEDLIDWFKRDSHLGIMTGVLLYPQSGGINHSGLSFYQYVGRHVFLNSRPAILPKEPYQVQAAALGFAAMRRDLLEVAGGFDPSYHYGYDDLDLTLRIGSSGAKVMVNPTVTAFHWERSDGPHRDTGRKRNLAIFWHRWGDQICNDLWSFLTPRLKIAFKDTSGTEDEAFLGIDLSGDRIAAKHFWAELAQHAAVIASDVRQVSHRCPKEGPIALPLVLGADGHYEPRRMLFLTDNFVRLRGNSYFLERRLFVRDDDLVVDFHGNALRIQELAHSAWPGDQIR